MALALANKINGSWKQTSNFGIDDIVATGLKLASIQVPLNNQAIPAQGLRTLSEQVFKSQQKTSNFGTVTTSPKKSK